jgi:hypothetical protein
MAKYRKKPVVIEAIQYHREKNIGECLTFCGNENLMYNPDTNEYEIPTLEGRMMVSDGDYIIRGVDGEYYPCKPDIFEKTYEEVTKNG